MTTRLDEIKAGVMNESKCGTTHYQGCACHEKARNACISQLEADCASYRRALEEIAEPAPDNELPNAEQDDYDQSTMFQRLALKRRDMARKALSLDGGKELLEEHRARAHDIDLLKKERNKLGELLHERWAACDVLRAKLAESERERERLHAFLLPENHGGFCQFKQHLAELESEREKLRMQLAACGVAALGNTVQSAKQRITKDNPYWSASYQDVCNTVDREMALEDRLALAERVVDAAREVDKQTGFYKSLSEALAAYDAAKEGG